MRFFGRLVSSVGLFSISICQALHAGPVTVFSSGFAVPETISLAPSSFGLPAGTLVVADRGDLQNGGSTPSIIYSVPLGGGTPTPISASLGSSGIVQGGIFAPASFGSLGGNYLGFGATTTGGVAFSLTSPGGTLTPFYSDSNVNYVLNVPVLAPSGYGSVGGDILAPEEVLAGSPAPVMAFSPSGSVSIFATISNFSPILTSVGGFGTVFAPAGFIPGTTGPVLLVGDIASGKIDWIDSAGNAHLFTTVPLGVNQVALRQMAFAPAGFGAYGGDLFVSVSGSHAGGGTFGSVDVITSAGSLVGIISQGTVAAPFDPRGLYFASSSQLLIADADPSILSAPPSAVTATPEPATEWSVAFALGIFAMVGFLRRKRADSK